MTWGFSETIIGGVLFAPFVRYALGACVIFLLAMRPLLRRIPMHNIFANPPFVSVCLYILVLAALIVLA